MVPRGRGSKTAILGSVATPPSGEFASVQPSSELPFSADVGTDSITAAMSRGPAIERRTAPVVGSGPGREVSEAAPEMDFGEDLMGDFMGGLQQPGAFNPTAGMPGSLIPTAANLSSPIKGMPGTTPGGHIIPEHLYGNPRAIAALKRSGLSYDEWERTMDASNYI